MNPVLLIKALVALTAVWAVFATIGHFADQRKATPERFITVYEKSRLRDHDAEKNTTERFKDIEELSEVYNRIDIVRRQDLRSTGEEEKFFYALSTDEQKRWLEITLEKSMNKFMQALDSMAPAQRKKFVEQAITQLEKSKTGNSMEMLKKVDPEIIEKIIKDGMTAYYQKAGPETKLALAPLMEMTNETIQGIRGTPFDTAR